MLRLRAPPESADPIHELRALLKRLLRVYQWQCVDLWEVKETAPDQNDERKNQERTST